MYRFSDKNENDDISLHDCRATHISINENTLSFKFANGIWIGANNKQNPYRKTLCTGKAKVSFTLPESPDYDVAIYVFTEKKRENYPQRVEP